MMPHHCTNSYCPEPPPNKRLQLTTEGARDRAFFDSFAARLGGS